MFNVLCPLCSYNEPKYRQTFSNKDLYTSDIFIPVPAKVNETINFKRFNIFLDNINNQKIDSVRVITRDIENQPYINNLFYNGHKIIYIEDASKISGYYGKPYINSYEGDRIVIQESELAISYYLQNKSVNVVEIFHLRKIKNRYQY